MYVIDINKDLVPYTFNIALDGVMYEFRIDYNNTADLFTVSLAKNGVTLCTAEPIVYGLPLFEDLKNRGNFPSVVIKPVDESGENNAVTFDNLSRTVLLQVSGGGYDE